MKKMMMVFVVLFAMVGSSFGRHTTFVVKSVSVLNQDNGATWPEGDILVTDQNDRGYRIGNVSTLAGKGVLALALAAKNTGDSLFIDFGHTYTTVPPVTTVAYPVQVLIK